MDIKEDNEGWGKGASWLWEEGVSEAIDEG